MRYQNKSSMAYMFRNFWKLVYVMLPVTALFAVTAMLYNPSEEIGLLALVAQNGITMENCTNELLRVFSVLRYGTYWWLALCVVVALSFAMSLMVVKIERHMRMGLMPALPIRRAFGIFPIMLLYILCWIVATEAVNMVAVGISYMLGFVGNAKAIVAIVFVLLFAGKVLLTYLFAVLSVSFPLKYSENYRFNRAMSYSARIMYPQKRIIWTVGLVYPLLRLAVFACAYLLRDYHLDWAVYALAFLFATTYVPCLSFKQYYDDVGGERRDVGQIMFG